MNAVTVVFLVIGGAGVAVLAVSLLIGDLVNLGHPDVDGPFSLPAVAGFAGAFGFAGAVAAERVARHTTAGSAAALAGVLVGLLAAVPTAWLAMRLSRAASSMRTDATPTRSDLVGTTGTVVTPIPADGYGEVRVTLAGQPVKVNARADRPIACGAHVFVVEAPTPTSVIVEETPFVKEA